MARRHARRVAHHKARRAHKVRARKAPHPRHLKPHKTPGKHGTHGVQHKVRTYRVKGNPPEEIL